MQKIDRDAVQVHVDYGMPLLKLGHKMKSPVDVGWRKRKYAVGTIMVHAHKGGNVGIAIPENVIVMDVDPKHSDAQGRTAAELLVAAELEWGYAFDGPTVETGSGGLHVYMTYDPGRRLRETSKAFGGAIEFKKHGKLMVAAGSIHPNGKPYTWLRKGEMQPAPEALLEALRRPDPGPARDPTEAAMGTPQIKALLEQLDPTEFRGYDDWRNLMFATHDACCGDRGGRDAFVAWSTTDPEYAGADQVIESMWAAVKDDAPEGRTAGTLFWHVLQVGGGIPPPPAEDDFPDDLPEEPKGEKREPTFERNARGLIKGGIAHNVCEALRVLDAPLAWSTFIHEVVQLPDGAPIDDEIASGYRKQISDKWRRRWTGDANAQALRDGILWYAQERKHHPIQDYLNSLAWDGTRRLETWLIEATEAEDNLYVRAVSYTLLLAAVARAFKPGVKYDLMVILEGPQGVGKSKLVRKLGGQWTLEGLPPLHSPNDKDVISAMLGCWIIEIEELASMRKADVDVLKAFITKGFDRVRMPYKERARTYPRQSVLIGTTNDAAYLRDPTGNRRFAPVYVGAKIDLEKINRDQLWAEATAEWKANPRNEVALPEEVWPTAAVEQEKRRAEDPWEELLAEALGKLDEPIHTRSVFEILHRNYTDVKQHEQKRLAQVMQSIGWKRGEPRINGTKCRGYFPPNYRR